jgi:hypothetical protein
MRFRTISILALLGLSAELALGQNCRPVGDGTTYTTMGLTTSVSSPSLCQSVTFTAQIYADDGTPSDGLTGSMIFYDGTAILATVPVSGGAASYSTSTLALGNHSMRAQYVPDQAYIGGASSDLLATVTGAATVSFGSSPNPSNPGQAVAITMRVAAPTCQGVPPASTTGTVFFFDGTAQIGQSSLVSGAATLQTSTLAAGSHTLSARYTGDTNFSAAASSSVIQVVSGSRSSTTTTSTTTTLTTSANPIATTKPLTLVASVMPSGATGQVQFNEGATTVGTATLSGGVASLITSNLTAGAHPLSAVYVGDTNFSASTSNTVNETVTGSTPAPSPASTTLSVSPNPASAGQAVILSATVTPSNAPGSVQFFDGATPLGQRDVSGGVATFQVSSFTAGTHTLTAKYLGDALTPPTPPNTSSPVTLTVTTGKQNTTTSLSGSTDMITSGQSLVLVATVTPATATGDVQFADFGNPIAIVALINGTATFRVSSLSIGSHSLSAAYMGDANFNPSTYPASASTVLTLSSATPDATARAVKAQDLSTASSLRVTVLAQPSLSISIPTPLSTADQSAAKVTLSPAYALPLTATFDLSFTPSGGSVSEEYTNPDVKFASGSTTSEAISIPANSSEPVALPAFQLGTLAGTITLKLATLTTSMGHSLLAANPPSAIVPVGRFVPSIVPGSVRVVNSSSGLSVVLDASSTTCDLTSANLTISPAAGALATSGRPTFSLTSPAAEWFAGAAANCGLANGGAFTVSIPFANSVDPADLNTVSVTLTNSSGTSAAATGGR